jgi:hypothetical protein
VKVSNICLVVEHVRTQVFSPYLIIPEINSGIDKNKRNWSSEALQF